MGPLSKRVAARAVTAGAVLLLVGAVLVDTGFAADLPLLERLGNLAMMVAGGGLALLPTAVAPVPKLARVGYWCGLALASMVDVPAVIDPTDLRAGRTLGFPAMLLLSASLFAMWRRTRIAPLLVGAGWFFVQLAPNVALFIVPDERPSFTLQVSGMAVALMLAVSGRTAPAQPSKLSQTAPMEGAMPGSASRSL